MNPKLRSLLVVLLISQAGPGALAQATTTTAEPFSITGRAFVGHGPGTGVGIGVDPEFIPGKSGRVAIALPLSVLFAGQKATAANNQGFDNTYRLLYAAPTVRWYPFSAYRPTSFSIGVRAALGALRTKQERDYGPGFGSLNDTRTFSSLFFSPGLDLGLTLRRPKGGIYGIYAAGGPMLRGSLGVDANNKTIPRSAFLEFGVRIGSVL